MTFILPLEWYFLFLRLIIWSCAICLQVPNQLQKYVLSVVQLAFRYTDIYRNPISWGKAVKEERCYIDSRWFKHSREQTNSLVRDSQQSWQQWLYKNDFCHLQRCISQKHKPTSTIVKQISIENMRSLSSRQAEKMLKLIQLFQVFSHTTWSRVCVTVSGKMF